VMPAALTSETDAAVLRAILKVTDGRVGTTGGYSAAPAIRAGSYRTTPRRAIGDDEPAVAPAANLRRQPPQPSQAQDGISHKTIRNRSSPSGLFDRDCPV
jgi:hypothetical protein